MPPPSATISAQLWMDAAPWRLTAGWSLLAALIATGALASWRTVDWRSLVLLWLLVDLLWGALWRMAGGRQHLLPLRAASDVEPLRLPYLQPHSPAAQLLSLDESNSLPWLVRVAFPVLVVALIASAALGVAAVVCTLLLALTTVAAWTLRRTLNVPPLLLHAVAVVALPWALTILLATSTASTLSATQAASALPGAPSSLWSATMLLGVLWTLHAWGEARLGVWPGDRIGLALLAVAQVGVALLLVVNKSPIGVPILAALVLPTWLRAARGQPLTGLSIWWTTAMLASAMALGWR